MVDESAFLAALAADPLDGVTRRVYADWLEERGDARAEYLRREIELAEIPINDPRWPAVAGWVRERVDAHDPAWVAAACPPYEVWLCACPEGSREVMAGALRELYGYRLNLTEARSILTSLPARLLDSVPFQAALAAAGGLLNRQTPARDSPPPVEIRPRRDAHSPLEHVWPTYLLPRWRFSLGSGGRAPRVRTREEVESASARTNPPGLMRIFESPAVTGPGMELDLACWQGLGLSRPGSGHPASGSMPS